MQNIRTIIEKDKNIQKYLQDNNFENLRYSNFGFIVVLPDFVLKHYIGKDFFKIYKINLNSDNFFFQEEKNYKIIKEKGNILIPNFEHYKTIEIPYKIEIAKIENVRKNCGKIDSFTEIEVKNLISTIQKFHTIEQKGNKNFIHGNIHPTNFFLKNGKIGIFDFVSCRLDYKEIDLARILIYSNYNIDFWNKIKDFYKDSLNKKVLEYYIKEHSLENYKYGKNMELVKKMKDFLEFAFSK